MYYWAYNREKKIHLPIQKQRRWVEAKLLWAREINPVNNHTPLEGMKKPEVMPKKGNSNFYKYILAIFHLSLKTKLYKVIMIRMDGFITFLL